MSKRLVGPKHSIDIMILAMKEPQNSGRNNKSIMLHMCLLLPFLRLLTILDATTLFPHLDLRMYHALIEAKVSLRREKSIPNIQTLDLGMLRASPDMDLLTVF